MFIVYLVIKWSLVRARNSAETENMEESDWRAAVATSWNPTCAVVAFKKC